MDDHADESVLAFVPRQMQAYMEQLEVAAPGNLSRVASIEELVHASAEKPFAVALIPASATTSEQWWSIWGCVNAMEPKPAILVYAVRSDFAMWSSVLEAGGYDVVVAPFTAEKLRSAIKAAAADCARQRKD